MLERCKNRLGRPGYRWGSTGKIFAYDTGDAVGRKKAKTKAMKAGETTDTRAGAVAAGPVTTAPTTKKKTTKKKLKKKPAASSK